ncbi:MAG: 16S rRNA (cytidine(1402)-2'-O)-methyltransferase [Candidatus Dadabacteria bacterium RIFCSPHIGHO2_12_FULL_53_21]|nr:MAG: 16S rRNA (cytidine(1402)-2'-O)-methyltransferase [Candidatus Dadabacteria bacterium RIFCSPHIGHO2_12_FULL_53_21]
MSGRLYIVSTPIGNLEDITLRALKVLKEADVIACEDTRTTRKLLTRYAVETPLVSYHEHNEIEKAKELLSILREGRSIALVSDAGTPCISDPGYRIVKLASEHGIEVLSIPGPSASVSALSVSGLPTSSFAFFGFLPRTKKHLTDYLSRIKNYPETLVFYESPNRVTKTLRAISEVFGDRNISLSREMTKLYEETLRGKVSDVLEALVKRNEIKGEVTIVVEGASSEIGETDPETIDRMLVQHKKIGSSLKDAVKMVSGESGYSKSKTYKRALQIWGRE